MSPSDHQMGASLNVGWEHPSRCCAGIPLQRDAGIMRQLSKLLLHVFGTYLAALKMLSSLVLAPPPRGSRRRVRTAIFLRTSGRCDRFQLGAGEYNIFILKCS